MLIWRNNQLEDVDEYEFNNWLATIIKNAAIDFGLEMAVVEAKPPTLQREFWTRQNGEKTHFVLKSVTPAKDDYRSYLIHYEILAPDGSHIEAHSIMTCTKWAGSIREDLEKLSRWYYLGEPMIPPPPKPKT